MQPVQYMDRTRAYYEAQGFERAYVWASHEDAPFQPLTKPLSESTLGIITTAALYDRQSTDTREASRAPTSPPPERLYGGDLSWDKEATHLDDLGSYFPLEHLNGFVEDGTLGAISKHFYCAPTEYSQRRTIAADAPQILDWCIEDQVDVALLVPL